MSFLLAQDLTFVLVILIVSVLIYRGLIFIVLKSITVDKEWYTGLIGISNEKWDLKLYENALDPYRFLPPKYAKRIEALGKSLVVVLLILFGCGLVATLAAIAQAMGTINGYFLAYPLSIGCFLFSLWVGYFYFKQKIKTLIDQRHPKSCEEYFAIRRHFLFETMTLVCGLTFGFLPLVFTFIGLQANYFIPSTVRSIKTLMIALLFTAIGFLILVYALYHLLKPRSFLWRLPQAIEIVSAYSRGHMGEVSAVYFISNSIFHSNNQHQRQQIQHLKNDKGGKEFSILITFGKEDGTIKEWNLDGKLLRSVKAHRGEITATYVNQNGSNIITAGRNDVGICELKRWDFAQKICSTPLWTYKCQMRNHISSICCRILHDMPIDKCSKSESIFSFKDTKENLLSKCSSTNYSTTAAGIITDDDKIQKDEYFKMQEIYIGMSRNGEKEEKDVGQYQIAYVMEDLLFRLCKGEGPDFLSTPVGPADMWTLKNTAVEFFKGGDHDTGISCMIPYFSFADNDKPLLLSGSLDGNIKIWDCKSRSILKTLTQIPQQSLISTMYLDIDLAGIEGTKQILYIGTNDNIIYHTNLPSLERVLNTVSSDDIEEEVIYEKLVSRDQDDDLELDPHQGKITKIVLGTDESGFQSLYSSSLDGYIVKWMRDSDFKNLQEKEQKRKQKERDKEKQEVAQWRTFFRNIITFTWDNNKNGMTSNSPSPRQGLSEVIEDFDFIYPESYQPVTRYKAPSSVMDCCCGISGQIYVATNDSLVAAYRTNIADNSVFRTACEFRSITIAEIAQPLIDISILLMQMVAFPMDVEIPWSNEVNDLSAFFSAFQFNFEITSATFLNQFWGLFFGVTIILIFLLTDFHESLLDEVGRIQRGTTFKMEKRQSKEAQSHLTDSASSESALLPENKKMRKSSSPRTSSFGENDISSKKTMNELLLSVTVLDNMYEANVLRLEEMTFLRDILFMHSQPIVQSFCKSKSRNKGVKTSLLSTKEELTLISSCIYSFFRSACMLSNTLTYQDISRQLQPYVDLKREREQWSVHDENAGSIKETKSKYKRKILSYIYKDPMVTYLFLSILLNARSKSLYFYQDTKCDASIYQTCQDSIGVLKSWILPLLRARFQDNTALEHLNISNEANQANYVSMINHYEQRIKSSMNNLKGIMMQFDKNSFLSITDGNPVLCMECLEYGNPRQIVKQLSRSITKELTKNLHIYEKDLRKVDIDVLKRYKEFTEDVILETIRIGKEVEDLVSGQMVKFIQIVDDTYLSRGNPRWEKPMTSLNSLESFDMQLLKPLLHHTSTALQELENKRNIVFGLLVKDLLLKDVKYVKSEQDVKENHTGLEVTVLKTLHTLPIDSKKEILRELDIRLPKLKSLLGRISYDVILFVNFIIDKYDELHEELKKMSEKVDTRIEAEINQLNNDKERQIQDRKDWEENEEKNAKKFHIEEEKRIEQLKKDLDRMNSPYGRKTIPKVYLKKPFPESKYQYRSLQEKKFSLNFVRKDNEAGFSKFEEDLFSYLVGLKFLKHKFENKFYDNPSLKKSFGESFFGAVLMRKGRDLFPMFLSREFSFIYDDAFRFQENRILNIVEVVRGFTSLHEDSLFKDSRRPFTYLDYYKPLRDNDLESTYNNLSFKSVGNGFLSLNVDYLALEPRKMPDPLCLLCGRQASLHNQTDPICGVKIEDVLQLIKDKKVKPEEEWELETNDEQFARFLQARKFESLLSSFLNTEDEFLYDLNSLISDHFDAMRSDLDIMKYINSHMAFKYKSVLHEISINRERSETNTKLNDLWTSTLNKVHTYIIHLIKITFSVGHFENIANSGEDSDDLKLKEKIFDKQKSAYFEKTETLLNGMPMMPLQHFTKKLEKRKFTPAMASYEKEIHSACSDLLQSMSEYRILLLKFAFAGQNFNDDLFEDKNFRYGKVVEVLETESCRKYKVEYNDNDRNQMKISTFEEEHYQPLSVEYDDNDRNDRKISIFEEEDLQPLFSERKGWQKYFKKLHTQRTKNGSSSLDESDLVEINLKTKKIGGYHPNIFDLAPWYAIDLQEVFDRYGFFVDDHRAKDKKNEYKEASSLAYTISERECSYRKNVFMSAETKHELARDITSIEIQDSEKVEEKGRRLSKKSLPTKEDLIFSIYYATPYLNENRQKERKLHELRNSFHKEHNIQSKIIDFNSFIHFCTDFNIYPQLLSLQELHDIMHLSCSFSVNMLGEASGTETDDIGDRKIFKQFVNQAILLYPDFIEAILRISKEISWTNVYDIVERKKILLDWTFIERHEKIVGEAQRRTLLTSSVQKIIGNSSEDNRLTSLFQKRDFDLTPNNITRINVLHSLIKEENKRRKIFCPDLVENIRKLVQVSIYVGINLAAIPIIRCFFEIYNCNAQGKWVIDDEVSCYKEEHIVKVVFAITATIFYLPFWFRYSAVGGDATQIRTPDGEPLYKKIKYALWNSFGKQIAATKEKNVSSEIEMGFLTKSKTAVFFQVGSASSKLLLVLGSVFLASTTVDSYFTLIIILLQTVALYWLPPFKSVGSNMVVSASAVVILWTTVCAVCAANVDNVAVSWPAILWYSGLIPSTLIGIWLSNLYYSEDLLKMCRSIRLRRRSSVDIQVIEDIKDHVQGDIFSKSDADLQPLKFSNHYKIHDSAWRNQFKRIDRMLKRDYTLKKELDAVDNFGLSPFLYAVRKNDSMGSCLQLLKHGADKSVKDCVGKNALHLFAKKGNRLGFLMIKERAYDSFAQNGLIYEEEVFSDEDIEDEINERRVDDAFEKLLLQIDLSGNIPLEEAFVGCKALLDLLQTLKTRQFHLKQLEQYFQNKIDFDRLFVHSIPISVYVAKSKSNSDRLISENTSYGNFLYGRIKNIRKNENGDPLYDISYSDGILRESISFKDLIPFKANKNGVSSSSTKTKKEILSKESLVITRRFSEEESEEDLPENNHSIETMEILVLTTTLDDIENCLDLPKLKLSSSQEGHKVLKINDADFLATDMQNIDIEKLYYYLTILDQRAVNLQIKIMTLEKKIIGFQNTRINNFRNRMLESGEYGAFFHDISISNLKAQNEEMINDEIEIAKVENEKTKQRYKNWTDIIMKLEHMKIADTSSTLLVSSRTLLEDYKIDFLKKQLNGICNFIQSMEEKLNRDYRFIIENLWDKTFSAIKEKIKTLEVKNENNDIIKSDEDPESVLFWEKKLVILSKYDLEVFGGIMDTAYCLNKHRANVLIRRDHDLIKNKIFAPDIIAYPLNFFGLAIIGSKKSTLSDTIKFLKSDRIYPEEKFSKADHLSLCTKDLFFSRKVPRLKSTIVVFDNMEDVQLFYPCVTESGQIEPGRVTASRNSVKVEYTLFPNNEYQYLENDENYSIKIFEVGEVNEKKKVEMLSMSFQSKATYYQWIKSISDANKWYRQLKQQLYTIMVHSKTLLQLAVEQNEADILRIVLDVCDYDLIPFRNHRQETALHTLFYRAFTIFEREKCLYRKRTDFESIGTTILTPKIKEMIEVFWNHPNMEFMQKVEVSYASISDISYDFTISNWNSTGDYRQLNDGFWGVKDRNNFSILTLYAIYMGHCGRWKDLSEYVTTHMTDDIDYSNRYEICSYFIKNVRMQADDFFRTYCCNKDFIDQNLTYQQVDVIESVLHLKEYLTASNREPSKFLTLTVIKLSFLAAYLRKETTLRHLFQFIKKYDISVYPETMEFTTKEMNRLYGSLIGLVETKAGSLSFKKLMIEFVYFLCAVTKSVEIQLPFLQNTRQYNDPRFPMISIIEIIIFSNVYNEEDMKILLDSAFEKMQPSHPAEFHTSVHDRIIYNLSAAGKFKYFKALFSTTFWDINRKAFRIETKFASLDLVVQSSSPLDIILDPYNCYSTDICWKKKEKEISDSSQLLDNGESDDKILDMSNWNALEKDFFNSYIQLNHEKLAPLDVHVTKMKRNFSRSRHIVEDETGKIFLKNIWSDVGPEEGNTKNISGEQINSEREDCFLKLIECYNECNLQNEISIVTLMIALRFSYTKAINKIIYILVEKEEAESKIRQENNDRFIESDHDSHSLSSELPLILWVLAGRRNVFLEIENILEQITFAIQHLHPSHLIFVIQIAMKRAIQSYNLGFIHFLFAKYGEVSLQPNTFVKEVLECRLVHFGSAEQFLLDKSRSNLTDFEYAETIKFRKYVDKYVSGEEVEKNFLLQTVSWSSFLSFQSIKKRYCENLAKFNRFDPRFLAVAIEEGQAALIYHLFDWNAYGTIFPRKFDENFRTLYENITGEEFDEKSVHTNKWLLPIQVSTYKIKGSISNDENSSFMNSFSRLDKYVYDYSTFVRALYWRNHQLAQDENLSLDLCPNFSQSPLIRAARLGESDIFINIFQKIFYNKDDSNSPIYENIIISAFCFVCLRGDLELFEFLKAREKCLPKIIASSCRSGVSPLHLALLSLERFYGRNGNKDFEGNLLFEYNDQREQNSGVGVPFHRETHRLTESYELFELSRENLENYIPLSVDEKGHIPSFNCYNGGENEKYKETVFSSGKVQSDSYGSYTSTSFQSFQDELLPPITTSTPSTASQTLEDFRPRDSEQSSSPKFNTKAREDSFKLIALGKLISNLNAYRNRKRQSGFRSFHIFMKKVSKKYQIKIIDYLLQYKIYHYMDIPDLVACVNLASKLSFWNVTVQLISELKKRVSYDFISEKDKSRTKIENQYLQYPLESCTFVIQNKSSSAVTIYKSEKGQNVPLKKFTSFVKKFRYFSERKSDCALSYQAIGLLSLLSIDDYNPTSSYLQVNRVMNSDINSITDHVQLYSWKETIFGCIEHEQYDLLEELLYLFKVPLSMKDLHSYMNIKFSSSNKKNTVQSLMGLGKSIKTEGMTDVSFQSTGTLLHDFYNVRRLKGFHSVLIDCFIKNWVKHWVEHGYGSDVHKTGIIIRPLNTIFPFFSTQESDEQISNKQDHVFIMPFSIEDFISRCRKEVYERFHYGLLGLISMRASPWVEVAIHLNILNFDANFSPLQKEVYASSNVYPNQIVNMLLFMGIKESLIMPLLEKNRSACKEKRSRGTCFDLFHRDKIYLSHSRHLEDCTSSNYRFEGEEALLVTAARFASQKLIECLIDSSIALTVTNLQHIHTLFEALEFAILRREVEIVSKLVHLVPRESTIFSEHPWSKRLYEIACNPYLIQYTQNYSAEYYGEIFLKKRYVSKIDKYIYRSRRFSDANGNLTVIDDDVSKIIVLGCSSKSKNQKFTFKSFNDRLASSTKTVCKRGEGIEQKSIATLILQYLNPTKDSTSAERGTFDTNKNLLQLRWEENEWLLYGLLESIRQGSWNDVSEQCKYLYQIREEPEGTSIHPTNMNKYVESLSKEYSHNCDYYHSRSYFYKLKSVVVEDERYESNYIEKYILPIIKLFSAFLIDNHDNESPNGCKELLSQTHEVLRCILSSFPIKEAKNVGSYNLYYMKLHGKVKILDYMFRLLKHPKENWKYFQIGKLIDLIFILFPKMKLCFSHQEFQEVVKCSTDDDLNEFLEKYQSSGFSSSTITNSNNDDEGSIQEMLDCLGIAMNTGDFHMSKFFASLISSHDPRAGKKNVYRLLPFALKSNSTQILYWYKDTLLGYMDGPSLQLQELYFSFYEVDIDKSVQDAFISSFILPLIADPANNENFDPKQFYELISKTIEKEGIFRLKQRSSCLRSLLNVEEFVLKAEGNPSMKDKYIEFINNEIYVGSSVYYNIMRCICNTKNWNALCMMRMHSPSKWNEIPILIYEDAFTFSPDFSDSFNIDSNKSSIQNLCETSVDSRYRENCYLCQNDQKQLLYCDSPEKIDSYLINAYLNIVTCISKEKTVPTSLYVYLQDNISSHEIKFFWDGIVKVMKDHPTVSLFQKIFSRLHSVFFTNLTEFEDFFRLQGEEFVKSFAIALQSSFPYNEYFFAILLYLFGERYEYLSNISESVSSNDEKFEYAFLEALMVYSSGNAGMDKSTTIYTIIENFISKSRIPDDRLLSLIECFEKQGLLKLKCSDYHIKSLLTTEVFYTQYIYSDIYDLAIAFNKFQCSKKLEFILKTQYNNNELPKHGYTETYPYDDEIKNTILCVHRRKDPQENYSLCIDRECYDSKWWLRQLKWLNSEEFQQLAISSELKEEAMNDPLSISDVLVEEDFKEDIVSAVCSLCKRESPFVYGKFGDEFFKVDEGTILHNEPCYYTFLRDLRLKERKKKKTNKGKEIIEENMKEDDYDILSEEYRLEADNGRFIWNIHTKQWGEQYLRFFDSEGNEIIFDKPLLPSTGNFQYPQQSSNHLIIKSKDISKKISRNRKAKVKGAFEEEEKPFKWKYYTLLSIEDVEYNLFGKTFYILEWEIKMKYNYFEAFMTSQKQRREMIGRFLTVICVALLLYFLIYVFNY